MDKVIRLGFFTAFTLLFHLVFFPKALANPGNEVDVTHFGAIPDDGKDDSEAMQKAINFAMKNKEGGRVYIPPGVYDLEKGIVVANMDESGTLGFVTLTVSGHQAAYSSNQKIGRVSVLRLKSPQFALGIQLARNCVIENLVFEGCADYNSDVLRIVNKTTQEWGSKAKASTNRFSPSCAIVIDPFHINVPDKERYRGFEKYYRYRSNGGSSMILIRGCAFSKHYIAIANNPSNGIQNGDNIRAEECHVTTCHTFWSAGQTQSRGNSIDNIYALFLHTLISGTQIGSQQGTPPTVSNLNMAGFCKMVFDIKTGFSGLNVYRSYFESIWSLGISLSNSTSFDQCQFKFYIPGDIIFSPPFHLYSDRIVAFRDCSIEFFNNCKSPMPFLFKSKELIISGGQIEGGVIVADGITNTGGDDLNKVKLDAVFVKCVGKVAGKKATMKPGSKIEKEILMGGEILIDLDGNILLNSGTTYEIEHIESILPQFDNLNKTITFESKNISNFKIGDNLFSDRSISTISSGMGNFNIRSFLGYVETIRGKTVVVRGAPVGVQNIKQDIYRVSYPTIDSVGSPGIKGDKIIRYRRQD